MASKAWPGSKDPRELKETRESGNQDRRVKEGQLELLYVHLINPNQCATLINDSFTSRVPKAHQELKATRESPDQLENVVLLVHKEPLEKRGKRGKKEVDQLVSRPHAQYLTEAGKILTIAQIRSKF